MKFALSLLLVSSLGLASAARYSRTISYEGDIVIRCGLENKGMEDLLSNDRVDVWKVTADHADIRLPNKMFNRIRGQFPECSVLHSNVESLVGEFEQKMLKRVNASAEWHDEYHTYEEIVNWYKELAEKNDVVTYTESIGKSYEGRDQPAIRIVAKDDVNMKIYFQCQIHAREWISGATCMYIAEYLAEQYGKDSRVTDLLERVEFNFVTFVNPDGYVYTWNGDRLWRKNRQVNSGSSCRGVDLNRNYNDHWNSGGSSSNPCSETYHGTSAASEPETQNTQNYFKGLGNIIGAIDWHSYSQLILRPYGWTTADSPDEAQLSDLGSKMRAAILAVHGKAYTSQKSVGLYPTSGTASDWFYGEDATSTNGEYRAAGYTIELRDTGQYGFLLPADQIIPTGEENVEGVLTFAQELADNPIKQ